MTPSDDDISRTVAVDGVPPSVCCQLALKDDGCRSDTTAMARPYLAAREASSPGPRGPEPSAWLEQRLRVVSDLARVVSWETGPPDFRVTWAAPVSRVVSGASPTGVYWMAAPGRTHDGRRSLRPVQHEELGDAVLAPIIEMARAGMLYDDCELVQEVVAPDGETRRLIVRAVRTSTPLGERYVGIVSEVATPEQQAPWVRPDVAERLQLLVEHSPDGVVVHQDGVIVYANAAAARMAGLEDPSVSVGRPMTSFLHPDHVKPVLERVSQLRDSGDVVKGHEIVLVRPGGSELSAEISSALTTWGGRPAYQVILHDISERKAAEEAHRARLAVERRYATAVAALEEAVVVLDRDGAVQAANESAVRILGRRLHWGFGDAVLTGGGGAWDQDGDPLAPEELPVARALSHRATRSHAVLGVMGDDGARQWLSVNTRLLDDQSVDGAAVVCSVSDITERKQLMDRLAWEARNDSLTGVSNRTGLLVRVEELLGDDDVVSGTVLLVVDIDRFKMVNDSLGHAAGDEVLRAFAHRLQGTVPAGASVGRLHGDVFAVVMTGVADTGSALAWAETVRGALARPLRLASGRTLNLATSIGVVRADPDERDAGRLLQDADLARLEAKSRHRGRVAMFDAGLREEIGGRLELEHDLRAAVTNGELRVEYQPVATLADGRVVGMEALVRWEHPSRGLLMPARFIELAEESELIVTLGSWVLVQSFSQMARWRAQHPDAQDAFVAVNVSPRQLEGNELLPAIDEALRRSGLPPSAVVLEITESGFVAEDPHITRLLDELRGIGLRLSVDDFGAGYSSLGQLKRLPVSFLKIDRSFVTGLGTSERDDHIVSVVAELGHSLGMRIIAEGIEQERQRAAAFRLGCDLYQGYLLGRPQPGPVAATAWAPGQS